MFLSVCVTTYNGERYLKQQLQSIILQVCYYDSEIIISDDGSSDSTKDIIRDLNEEKIKLIDGPKDGLVKNFENALSLAKGDIIFLSDQDDIWLPNKVADCLKYLEHNDLVVTDAIVVDEAENVIHESFFNSRSSSKGVAKNIYKNSYLGCCLAFNRKILEASLPFPSKVAMHDWWIGLIANAIGNVCFIDRKHLLYRRHELNASSTSNKSTASLPKKIEWRIHIFWHLLRRVSKIYFFSIYHNISGRSN